MEMKSRKTTEGFAESATASLASPALAGLRVPEYLNTRQAAAYLGVSRQFLEIARHRGAGGPEYVKLARLVRYRRLDLDAFMEAHLRRHTAKAP